MTTDHLLADLPLAEDPPAEIVDQPVSDPAKPTKEEIRAIEARMEREEAYANQESTVTIATVSFADEIAKAESNIRGWLAEISNRHLDIGRELSRVKDIVGHGKWTAWLEDNFDMDVTTARRYMRAAKFVDKHSGEASKLPEMAPSVLYRLSERDEDSALTAAVDNLIARHDAGERITLAKVDEAFAKAGKNAKPNAAAAKTAKPAVEDEAPAVERAETPAPVEDQTPAVIEDKAKPSVNVVPMTKAAPTPDDRKAGQALMDLAALLHRAGIADEFVSIAGPMQRERAMTVPNLLKVIANTKPTTAAA